MPNIIKRKLLEYFVLGVPVYRLRFRVKVSRIAIQRFYHLTRAVLALAEECREPFDGAIECDETMFGGHRKGKRGWGAAGKIIVLGILQHNGKVKVFPVQGRKAAGPYNPNTRYKGPEKIAIENNYIVQHRYKSRTGYIAGNRVNDIDKYIVRYGYKDAVKWAIDTFKYKTNDDLELLTTVDFVTLELKRQGKPITVDSIRKFIHDEKEWQDKLKSFLTKKHTESTE